MTVGATTGRTYAVLDAARDYARVALACRAAPDHCSLFDGDRGERMDHVAPHLFALDPHAVIAHLTVGGLPPGHVGVLLDADAPLADLRDHLRRFLTVRRARDSRPVYFRYYDPRTLRAFLPVCTPDELRKFFGPLTAFHCQTEDPGFVLTYTVRDGRLATDVTPLAEFLAVRHHVPVTALRPLIEALAAAGG